MASRGKRILVGCGIGCGALLLVSISSCVGFFVWLNRPGELLDPERLLGGDTTDDGGATGDAAAGETLFTGNSCAACHCDDATGGCALDAPSLVGISDATLDDVLRGAASHTGGKLEATDQDIADLTAYLASL